MADCADVFGRGGGDAAGAEAGGVICEIAGMCGAGGGVGERGLVAAVTILRVVAESGIVSGGKGVLEAFAGWGGWSVV